MTTLDSFRAALIETKTGPRLRISHMGQTRDRAALVVRARRNGRLGHMAVARIGGVFYTVF